MSTQSGSDTSKKSKRQPKKQAQTYESESESEDYAPPPRRKRGKKQGPLDSLALDNVNNTVGGLTQGVTGALGGVAGGAVQNHQQGGGGGGGGGKSDTLRLRLDLNLDVEITLKAKIHGDLELALLKNTSWLLDDSNERVCFKHVAFVACVETFPSICDYQMTNARGFFSVFDLVTLYLPASTYP
ncbi:uncharacterized protein B0T23DRAFT_398786 [Neurospora hispaniola]|uniref:Uncharacterized protein n=1 Tax=Neurospora hispaniola TaxID=588809 RepID=A0AAJ0I2X0_9PEZI|nr:hypothetical protein B0T23DRAFT_398786 [Neurospora hispaniola]